MTCCDCVRFEFLRCVFEEVIEFDEFITEDIRIGSQPLLVIVYELSEREDTLSGRNRRKKKRKG